MKGVSLVDKPACKTCVINANTEDTYEYKSDNMKKNELKAMISKIIDEKLNPLTEKFREFESSIEKTLDERLAPILEDAEDKDVELSEEDEEKVKEKIESEVQVEDIKKTRAEEIHDVSSVNLQEFKKSILSEIAEDNRLREIKDYITKLVDQGLVSSEKVNAEMKLAAANFDAYKTLTDEKIKLAEQMKELKMNERQSKFTPFTASTTEGFKTEYELEHGVDFTDWDKEEEVI